MRESAGERRPRRLFFNFGPAHAREMRKPSESLKLLSLAAALALAAGAFAASAVARRQTPSAPEATPAAQAAPDPHPLDAFDRAVQKKFHNVIGFGMARIATEKKFEPTTQEEKEAVGALKREGYRVALYLAGRAVLEEVPAEERALRTRFGDGMSARGMSGPIFVSPNGLRGQLPGAAALWDETRRAIGAFAAGGERYGFSAGGWEVEARPVRATGESCIECHSSRPRLIPLAPANGGPAPTPEPARDNPKVGDPLGVLLYAYRKAR